MITITLIVFLITPIIAFTIPNTLNQNSPIFISETASDGQRNSRSQRVPWTPEVFSNSQNSAPVLAATYYFNAPSTPTQQVQRVAYVENNSEPRNDDFTLDGIQLEMSRDSTVCQTVNGQKGSCYNAAECIARGGTPMGRCNQSGSEASVCCHFEVTCGESTSERFVYFHNPGYPRPSSYPNVCRVRISKNSRHVCQYRVDLISFNTAPPHWGNCTQDVFFISGQNENNVVPKICGYNSGQHFYFGVEESGTVTFHMLQQGNFMRRFNILISQIPCYDPSVAPSHCLQYYTGTHGSIASFNYDTANSLNPEYEGYPNDNDYIMCIRKEAGFCSINYQLNSQETGKSSNFAIGHSSSNGDELQLRTILTNDCLDDYLSIGDRRICSTSFQESKSRTEDDDYKRKSGNLTLDLAENTPNWPFMMTDSTPGPFILRFVSNDANNAKGFNLKYQQNPCK